VCFCNKAAEEAKEQDEGGKELGMEIRTMRVEQQATTSAQ
jgi:hypothetical protein